MKTKKPAKKKPAPKVVAARKLKSVHYTEEYLINPMHPVTINVVGCGGTGSQVLTSLARMNSALKALGHPGLFVRAIDNDKVSEANMGRQLFSTSEIGEYKCIALIGRINRFFSTDWKAEPELYKPGTKIKSANITISCVDSGAARKGIKEVLSQSKKTPDQPENGFAYNRRTNHSYTSGLQPYEKPFYWMDYGNMKDRGQVVIGTLRNITQPAKSEFNALATLSTIDKLHPDILKDVKGDDQGPSCSLAEALGKQDLFINTNLANMGLGILWKMFRELHIKYQGLYLNLETMSVNPIKIV